MRTLFTLLLALSACSHASSDPAKSTKATVGEPIRADAPVVALADVMKDPAHFKGKQFVTTGTVTAVCQSMGCWMEIKDDQSQAHVKMAGERFFVPKTSAGHKARVVGTIVDVGAGGAEDEECAHEAADQTKSQVAKIQLEASGVELD
jgi:hypothetical protein